MKKVFIGVLTALMLFAFVACENQTPVNSYDLAVVGIEVEGAPSILLGEKPEAFDYVVTATRYNGETFVVSADDLKFEISDTSSLTVNSATNKEAQKVGTVTYVGPYAGGTYGSTLTEEVNAYVYAVESLTVTGAEDAKYYQNVVGKKVNGVVATTDNILRKSDYTVTATYTDIDGEKQTSVLADDQYAVTGFDDKTVARVELTFAPVGKAYAEDGANEFTQADGKNTAYIIIQTDSISSWTVDAADTADEYVIGASATGAVPTTDDVVVTVNYASGAVEELSTGYTVANSWKTGVTEGKFAGTSGTIDVTYNGETKVATFAFVQNTVESFTINASAQVVPGTNLQASQLNVNATWKDAANEPVKDSDLRVTISENGYFAVGETQHIYKVTLTDYPSVPAQYVTVTASASTTPDDGDGEQ